VLACDELLQQDDLQQHMQAAHSTGPLCGVREGEATCAAAL
jgi:hypothetical protein